MTTPLEQALRELADEIDTVPGGLADRAWATGRVEVRRQRRTRAAATLTAIAAAAALVWVAVVSGVGRTDSGPAEPSPDDVPAQVTGYPQRVVDPGDVDPLPAKGAPLTAVMHSRTRPGESGGWLALRPDGSVSSVPGFLPRRIVGAEGARWEDGIPQPTLDPTGRWLAGFERVRAGDNPRLVIVDVTTGERHAETTVTAAPIATIPTDCGARAGAQLHWRPTADEPRVALACDVDGVRHVMVFDEQAQVVSDVPVEPGEEFQAGSLPCAVGMAGWLDDHRLLDVRACPPEGARDEQTILVEVETRPQGAGVTQLAVKPRDDRTSLLQGIITDERRLLIRSTREGHALSVAWGGGQDRQMWATAPDITTDSPFRDERRTHHPSVMTGTDAAGTPARLRGSSDVTLWTDGGLGVMSYDTAADPAVSLMVIDPALEVDAISFAESAIHGDVTRHRLGVRTSWWSWHPVESAVAGLGALALIPIGWVIARRRGWQGPSGPTKIALAVLIGVAAAMVLVVGAVKANEEPDPLPSPGMTAQ